MRCEPLTRRPCTGNKRGSRLASALALKDSWHSGCLSAPLAVTPFCIVSLELTWASKEEEEEEAMRETNVENHLSIRSFPFMRHIKQSAQKATLAGCQTSR